MKAVVNPFLVSQFETLTFGTTIYNNSDTRAKILTGEGSLAWC